MARLRRGDDDAHTAVWVRYWQKVIGKTCTKLKWRVKEVYEPGNVAASVMSSFFQHHTEDDIDVQAEDGIWDLLIEVTLRHCEKWNKRFRAKKRKREGSLLPIGVERAGTDGKPDAGFDPDDDEVRPDLIDEADYLAHLLHKLNTRLNDRGRQVVALHLSGLTNADVGQSIGISKTRVDQLFVQIKKMVNEEMTSPLSETQRQILAQYVAGLQPGEIAEQLGLSAEAVAQ
jgi:DNA-binding CsgD family transcriptional regulator